MAAAKTLAQLRTITRQLADIEEQEDAFPESEVDARINEGLKRTRGKLIRVGAVSLFSSEDTSITTTSGTALYTLPTDFQYLLGVVADDGGNYAQLEPWEDQDYAEVLQYGQSSGGSSVYHLKYQLRPTQIEFRPTPTAAYNITLRYIPTFTELDAASDTFDGVAGWELYACTCAAIDLKQKGEEDVTALLQKKEALAAEMQQLAPNRDRGRPYIVQDVRHDWAGNEELWWINDWGL